MKLRWVYQKLHYSIGYMKPVLQYWEPSLRSDIYDGGQWIEVPTVYEGG